MTQTALGIVQKTQPRILGNVVRGRVQVLDLRLVCGHEERREIPLRGRPMTRTEITDELLGRHVCDRCAREAREG